MTCIPKMISTSTTQATRRSLKVLICGGGCAGPALAFWLARAGHQPVVVERFPSLRVAGAQIDLRGEGVSVVRRMGLHDEVYSKLVHEKGSSLVDSNGKTRAFFPANTSGKGAQSITSEYEIMRGDMVQILYDATKDKVEYQFGKSLDHFEQDDKQVVAHFSDGSTDTFDLLVGADGQGSRIRKAIMPPGAPEPYHRVGSQIAYWMIPRIASDENVARAYNAPGGRMITLRSHSPTECQVYVILRENTEEAIKIHRAPVEEQKQFWASKIKDAGWQSERFIEGMKTTDNFYSLEVVHVRLDKWHKGRVVLLGDAGYCPWVHQLLLRAPTSWRVRLFETLTIQPSRLKTTKRNCDHS